MSLVEIEKYQEEPQAEGQGGVSNARLPTSIMLRCPDDFVQYAARYINIIYLKLSSINKADKDSKHS